MSGRGRGHRRSTGTSPNEGPAAKKPRLAAQGTNIKRTPHSVGDVAANKQVYKVKDIVGHCMRQGTKHWKVNWEGWEDPRHDTYEPLENLAGCEDFIARYEEELKMKVAEADKIQKDKEEAKEKKKEEEKKRLAALPQNQPSAEEVEAIEEHKSVFVGTNRRRSWVWQYFARSLQDAQYELCQLPDKEDPNKKCLQPIKLCGGPTPFKLHCQYVHNSAWLNHEALASDSGGSKAEDKQSKLEGPARAVISAAKRDRLHERATWWILKRNRPSMIAEADPELQDLMLEATDGAYQLPDHHVVNANTLKMSAEGQSNLRKINEELKKLGIKPNIAGVCCTYNQLAAYHDCITTATN